MGTKCHWLEASCLQRAQVAEHSCKHKCKPGPVHLSHRSGGEVRWHLTVNVKLTSALRKLGEPFAVFPGMIVKFIRIHILFSFGIILCAFQFLKDPTHALKYKPSLRLLTDVIRMMSHSFRLQAYE